MPDGIKTDGLRHPFGQALFQVGVPLAHDFFRDALLMDDMGNGGLQEYQGREFEHGAHGHAQHLAILFGAADLEHGIGHVANGGAGLGGDQDDVRARLFSRSW